jgi:hypothetical protein
MKRQRAHKRQEEMDQWNRASRAREDNDDTRYVRAQGTAGASSTHHPIGASGTLSTFLAGTEAGGPSMSRYTPTQMAQGCAASVGERTANLTPRLLADMREEEKDIEE